MSLEIKGLDHFIFYTYLHSNLIQWINYSLILTNALKLFAFENCSETLTLKRQSCTMVMILR